MSAPGKNRPVCHPTKNNITSLLQKGTSALSTFIIRAKGR